MHVRNVILSQGIEILCAQKPGISDFYPILPVCEQFIQKPIERLDEIPATLEITRVELRELEDQHADVGSERGTRTKE